MARSGEATKDRIIEEAETLIFEHGLSGTSIDMIITQAGVTKGAFFHHFKSKGELAEALIDKTADADRAMINSCITRAEKLSSDPLQQVLLFIGLTREIIESLDSPPKGCMFASFIYQKLEVPFDMQHTACSIFKEWRKVLGDKLALAKGAHPPVRDFDPYDLADLYTTIFEGALVMSRIFDEPAYLLKSLDYYRDLVSGYFDLLAETPKPEAAE